MSFQVFFYEAFEEEATALRRELPRTMKCGFTSDTIQEKGHAFPPASVISIRTQSVIPRDWSGQLNAILSRSTGYDHLTEYRDSVQNPPRCGYLPLYCHRAVAEHAMMLWMSLLRKLPLQMTQFKTFHRDGLTGAECLGKNLLVVGVGNVGHEVVKIGRGLGMKVLGVDIVRKHSDVNYTDPGEGLAKADVIVCAMNLTGQNFHYFDRDLLSETRPGSVFINVARGELADACALKELIRVGHLGGVGLDVYENEPRLAVSLRENDANPGEISEVIMELAKHPNVICTPHNAFNTAEAVQRKASQSAEQLSCLLENNRFLWPIPGPDAIQKQPTE